METIYFISVFLHIFSVLFWLGGITFLAFVLVPSISKLDNYPHVLEIISRRFSKITWNFIFPIIVITGYFNAYIRTGFISPAKWIEVSPYIFIKFHLFFLIVFLSAIHDFLIGKKALEYMKAGKQTNLRKVSSWIGRVNFILGILMLYFGIKVVRGF